MILKKIEEFDYKAVKIAIDKLEEDTKELANSLLKEIEFMNATLYSLKDEVNRVGVITDMSQGKYSIKRSNPALSTYTVLIKQYTNCIKQLNDLLPKDSFQNSSEFDEFVDD